MWNEDRIRLPVAEDQIFEQAITNFERMKFE